MNNTSSKRTHGKPSDSTIKTPQNSSKISCRTCGRMFSGMKGYHVHISNNKMCMLNPTSDVALLEEHRNYVNTPNIDVHMTICQQKKEEHFSIVGDNTIYTSDETDIAFMGEMNFNSTSSNDSDNSISLCGMESCTYSILNQWKDQHNRADAVLSVDDIHNAKLAKILHTANAPLYMICLLYTSDAADE